MPITESNVVLAECEHVDTLARIGWGDNLTVAARCEKCGRIEHLTAAELSAAFEWLGGAR